MLIFGPYRSIPKDEQFVVFNLSSQTQVIPRLLGLIVDPGYPIIGDEMEKQFDMQYYNYVLNDVTAFSSLMSILTALYDGNKVYVCIAEYSSDPFMSLINESFMKIIQTRYDIKYSIINEPEDYFYLDPDGCDFMSATGITTFDQDRNRFIQLSEEQRLLTGVAYV